MAKRKRQKFSELDTFPNTLQNFGNFTQPALRDATGKIHRLKGNWGSWFGNDHPIVLELACGKGEYTLAMAASDPAKNYIGIDIKGNRIWRGAKTALLENLAHVAFLRSTISALDAFFGAGEVSEIWITFPDPHLKRRKGGKRLTSPQFLALYKKILQPGGMVHLKTDDPTLFAFTLESLEKENGKILHADSDIHAKPLSDPRLAIKTYYERMHLEAGRTIYYICFRL